MVIMLMTLCLLFPPGDSYFEDVIQSIQKEVESLTSGGINKIIVLGHTYGLVDDGNEAIEIAKNVEGVDIVVLGGALLFQIPDNGKIIYMIYIVECIT